MSDWNNVYKLLWVFSQNRMSYADKFLQQAPIPPPRRRKKKMVETTKL